MNPVKKKPAKQTKHAEKMSADSRKTFKRIYDIAGGVFNAIQNQAKPELSFPIRALSNVKFNRSKAIIEMGDSKQSREFFDMNMAKKFMSPE